jgi:hypothetical protein
LFFGRATSSPAPAAAASSSSVRSTTTSQPGFALALAPAWCAARDEETCSRPSCSWWSAKDSAMAARRSASSSSEEGEGEELCIS